tara:strand:+ start:51 stop:428 length:378 start_codon:yes stop_codon:yes gene_type:complete
MKPKSPYRSFGILFFIVFVIIAFWPLLNENEIRIWALITSLIFLVLGLLNSRILLPFYNLWMLFGRILQKIIPPIVLGILFFFLVTPIGIMLKIFKKDVLNLDLKKKENSYWIKRKFKILFGKQF